MSKQSWDLLPNATSGGYTTHGLSGFNAAGIRAIVDRQHACAPRAEVLRTVSRAAHLSDVPRHIRRAALRYARDVHNRNFVLYLAVQSGRF